jgi:hypothetical protein
MKPETIKAIDKLFDWRNYSINQIESMLEMSETIFNNPEILALEGYNKTEWIMIGEVPESNPLELEGEQVLLNLLLIGNEEIVVAGYYEDGCYYNFETGDRLFNVTHWMPLPTPPKQ